jgi:hypothetical protein
VVVEGYRHRSLERVDLITDERLWCPDDA